MFTLFDYAHNLEIHQMVNSSTLYLMFSGFDYVHNLEILQMVNSSTFCLFSKWRWKVCVLNKVSFLEVINNALAENREVRFR